MGTRSGSVKEVIVNDVITTLRSNDSLPERVAGYVARFGMPLWDNSVCISREEEDGWDLFVPMYKEGVDEEINTIWSFASRGDTLYHVIELRNPSSTVVEEYWRFDYFTISVLGKKPSSGLTFDGIVATRAVNVGWDVKCKDAYITVEIGHESATEYKGTHCWQIANDFKGMEENKNPGTGVPGSNGTSGFPNPQSRPKPSVPKDGLGVFSQMVVESPGNLSEEAKKKLEQTIEEWSELCPVSEMINYFYNKDELIREILIDPIPFEKNGGSASYDTGGNILRFADENSIGHGAFIHEYFHFMQYVLTSGECSNKNQGIREMERQIFLDLLKLYLNDVTGDDPANWGPRGYVDESLFCDAPSLPKKIAEEYKKWLIAIYEKIKKREEIDIPVQDLVDWGEIYKEYGKNTEYKKLDFNANGYQPVLKDALELWNNCMKPELSTDPPSSGGGIIGVPIGGGNNNFI